MSNGHERAAGPLSQLHLTAFTRGGPRLPLQLWKVTKKKLINDSFYYRSLVINRIASNRFLFIKTEKGPVRISYIAYHFSYLRNTVFFPINLNVTHLSTHDCIAYRPHICLILLRDDLTIRWHINRAELLSVSVAFWGLGGFLVSAYQGVCFSKAQPYDT